MIEVVKQDYLAAPAAGEPWGVGFAGGHTYAVQTWGYQHGGARRHYSAQHARLRFGVGSDLAAQVYLHYDYKAAHDWRAEVEVDTPEVCITVASGGTDDIVRVVWASNPPEHAWASLEVLTACGWEIQFDTRLPHDLVLAMRSREQQNALRAMSGLAPLPTREPAPPRHGPWSIETTASPEPWTVTAGEVFTEGWGMW